MKLFFHVYCENIRHFESKEGLINVYKLRHGIHNLQFFISAGSISMFAFTSWIFLYIWKMRNQFLYIYILAQLHKSHKIEDHFCEMMFLEQYKHRDNIKRQTIFFVLSYLPTSFSSIYLPFLELFIFLPLSYSSLTLLTSSFSFHFHHPCLSSHSPTLTSCYCD